MGNNYGESKVRVRYAETDAMGVVYHSNYYVWFEVGRGDFLRDYKFSYKQMEEMGVILPVVETHCRYRIPAQYDDLLTIQTSVKQLTPVKIGFQYKVIRDHDNALLAEGETLHVFTDRTKRPVNIKKHYGELFEMLQEIANHESIDK